MDDCDALAHAIQRHFVTAPQIAKRFRRQMMASERKQPGSRAPVVREGEQGVVREKCPQETLKKEPGRRTLVREPMGAEDHGKRGGSAGMGHTARPSNLHSPEKGVTCSLQISNHPCLSVTQEEGRESVNEQAKTREPGKEKEGPYLEGDGTGKMSSQRQSPTPTVSYIERCRGDEQAQCSLGRKENNFDRAEKECHVLKKVPDERHQTLSAKSTDTQKLKRLEESVEVSVREAPPGEEEGDGLSCLAHKSLFHAAHTDERERIWSTRFSSVVEEKFGEECQGVSNAVLEQEDGCTGNDTRRVKKQADEQEKRQEDKEARSTFVGPESHHGFSSTERLTGQENPYSVRCNSPSREGTRAEKNQQSTFTPEAYQATDSQETRVKTEEKESTMESNDRERPGVALTALDDQQLQHHGPDSKRLSRCFSLGRRTAKGKSSQEEQEELEDILAAL